MSPKADSERQQTVKLGLPPAGFPVAMHFNRYAIVPAGDVRILQFALVWQNRTIAMFSASVSTHDVALNRERLLPYISKVQMEPAECEPWSFCQSDAPVPEVKVINAARSGDQAELSMFTFSMQVAFDWSKERKSGEMPADAVARLCCTTALQVKFFLDLFASCEDKP